MTTTNNPDRKMILLHWAMASSHLSKLLESQRERRRYRMIDLKRDRQTERERQGDRDGEGESGSKS